MHPLVRRSVVVPALLGMLAVSSAAASAQTAPPQTTPTGQTVPGSDANPGRQTTPGGQTTPTADTAPGGQPGAAFRAIPAYPKARFAPQGDEPERLTASVHMTKEETAPRRGFTGPT